MSDDFWIGIQTVCVELGIPADDDWLGHFFDMLKAGNLDLLQHEHRALSTS